MKLACPWIGVSQLNSWIPNEVHALISVFPPRRGDQPTLLPLLPPRLSMGASAHAAFGHKLGWKGSKASRDTLPKKHIAKPNLSRCMLSLSRSNSAKGGDALAQAAQGGAPELQGRGPEGHGQWVQWEGLDVGI